MMHRKEEEIGKMRVVPGRAVKVRVCEDFSVKGEKGVVCAPAVETFSSFCATSRGSTVEIAKMSGDKLRRVSMSVSPVSGEKGNSENSSVVFTKKK
jgi:hypothetical protein